MLDPHTWSWPQWTYLALIFLSLSIAAVNHGKPRDEQNFPTSFISALIVLFLLTMGGFFGEAL